MRIHCTNKLLDKIKHSEILEQDMNHLDENYEDSPQADQLYDWHANFITLGMFNEWFVIMVNDLTALPVVVGPFTRDSFHQFEEIFKYTLAVLMRKQGLPKDLIENYLSGSEALKFTKTLGPKKLGPLNSVKRDLGEVFNRPFVTDIDSIEISEWLSSILRSKENDYYKPIESWLEEWENRTDSSLVDNEPTDDWKDMEETLDRAFQTELIEEVETLDETNSLKQEVDVPTPSEWRYLYKVARKFNQARPWETLYDTDLILVEHPITKEIAYCSIMGAYSEYFGLSIYIGDEGLINFDRIASRDKHIPDHQLLHAQDCLSVSFENRNDLEKINYDHIRSLGLSFRGTKQWPEVKKFEPGYHPWLSLNKEEVEWLTIALEQIPYAAKDLEDRTIIPDFSLGIFPGRVKQDTNGEWETVSLRLPDPDNLYEEKLDVIIEDEVTMRRLEKIPAQIDTIQLDVLYAPAPVQESKDQRPFYPRLILAVDPQNSFILNQDTYESKEKDVEKILSFLVDLCEKIKPKIIEVRERSIEWIIKDFCVKTGIELQTREALPFIDQVMNDMRNMF